MNFGRRSNLPLLFWQAKRVQDPSGKIQIMDKRITYSQNFLINKTLVSELIEKSSITDKDIVYEIGAGEGIITKELLKKAEKVIAFELDVILFDKLSKKFQNEKSLELKFGNFLDFDLPNLPQCVSYGGQTSHRIYRAGMDR